MHFFYLYLLNSMINTAKNVLRNIRNYNSISGIRQEGYEGYTIHQIESEKNLSKNEIIKFLNTADLGIEDLKVSKLDIENFQKTCRFFERDDTQI